MIDLINRLLQSGHAYREDHSVYYRISKFPEYGRLARLDKRELKIGARIEADEYEKEEPRDFVLWKAPKDDREPRWDSPFGPGRPGWHIECSAMATKHLGETLDIHCGAVDNIFPHHENEIAQSEAATGKQFVRFWIHGEHLLVESEKMAKSKGNFYTLRDLMEMGHTPLAVRYALLSVPYRKPLNFTLDGLHAAKQALDRIAEFLFRLTPAKLSPGSNPDVIKDLKEAVSHFEAGLDDDLNTAQALAAVFDFIRKTNTCLTEDRLLDRDRTEILAWFRIIDDRLAIVPAMEDLVQGDREIDALIEERNQARRSRDFALSDQIRRKLLDRGIVIEDTKEGTRWRRK
jgi:cysteinyl-tRNA synthetase